MLAHHSMRLPTIRPQTWLLQVCVRNNTTWPVQQQRGLPVSKRMRGGHQAQSTRWRQRLLNTSSVFVTRVENKHDVLEGMCTASMICSQTEG